MVTKIDAINGYALGIAKRVGIECPQLAEHYKAVKALGLKLTIYDKLEIVSINHF